MWFTRELAVSVVAITSSLSVVAPFLRNPSRNCCHFSRQQPFLFSRYFSKQYASVMAYTTTATSTGDLFDKSQFDVELPLLSLRIETKQTAAFLKTLDSVLLQRPKIKRVYNCGEDVNSKLLLLSEEIKEKSLAGVPDHLLAFIKQHGATVEDYKLSLGYDQMSVEEVLTRLLPAGCEVPSSFEQAGHIAHMNIRDELLPYKSIIGRVIVDKNKAIRTVVNKLGEISTKFRTFPMEVLAGEEDFNVELNESGCRFRFNFADVYWNSRLQQEHGRLIDLIRNASNDVASTRSADNKYIVADMMAGVGPFAVPLSATSAVAQSRPHALKKSEGKVKKGSDNGLKIKGADGNNINNNTDTGRATAIAPPLLRKTNLFIHGNDLNPSSYKYLCENSKLNSCGANLRPYNLDAREFMLMLMEQQCIPDEVIMNLPQSATDFLDVFIGMGTRMQSMKRQERTSTTTTSTATTASDDAPPLQLPRIHVYAFSTFMEDPVMDIARRSANTLRCGVEQLNMVPSATNIATPDAVAAGVAEWTPAQLAAQKVYGWGHIVRDVAPKKVMVCLTFTLPKEVFNSCYPLPYTKEGVLIEAHMKELPRDSVSLDSTPLLEQQPQAEVAAAAAAASVLGTKRALEES